jgi:hypothetical protein
MKSYKVLGALKQRFEQGEIFVVTHVTVSPDGLIIIILFTSLGL